MERGVFKVLKSETNILIHIQIYIQWLKKC